MELGITYQNRPSYNITAIDSAIVASPAKWYNWTVTSAAKKGESSASKTLNLVMVIGSKSSDFFPTSFDSREQQSFMTGFIPKLTITYLSQEPIPEYPMGLALPLLAILAIPFMLLAKRRRIRQMPMSFRFSLKSFLASTFLDTNFDAFA
jgi:hypothetical protein